MDPDNIVDIVAVISIFVLSPITIAVARLIWRRAQEPATPPALNDDSARRIIEMQRSIDAMAVEIERISENQRFVTKLMSERPAAELPAQPKRVAARRDS